VNKLLRAWKKAGLVTHRADAIVVHRIDALREIARGHGGGAARPGAGRA
jgi:hypothetical protein